MRGIENQSLSAYKLSSHKLLGGVDIYVKLVRNRRGAETSPVVQCEILPTIQAEFTVPIPPVLAPSLSLMKSRVPKLQSLTDSAVSPIARSP